MTYSTADAVVILLVTFGIVGFTEVLEDHPKVKGKTLIQK